LNEFNPLNELTYEPHPSVLHRNLSVYVNFFSVATTFVYNSKGFHYKNLVQNSFHKPVARRRDAPSGYMRRLVAGRTQCLINH